MKLIDKTAVENILRELWIEDREGIPLRRIYYNKALGDVQDTLDTLEVKEVDLVKEYDNNFSNDIVYSTLVNRNAGIGIAKHFFNLGLRTQKGEFKKESNTECPNFDEAQGTPV